MEKNNCRLCNSDNLDQFLDLGYSPHSDQFRKDLNEPETWYPLRLKRCIDCGFVQLSHVVDPETLYQKDYLYESSITRTADTHWIEFADSVIGRTGITSGVVLDIGSNDGTLLKKFKSRGFKIVGIDPCREVAELAVSSGIPTVIDFFSKDSVRETGYEKFDLITGSNVFAHIDDLHEVMRIIKSNLSKEGTFIFESPYLGDFLENYQYDTVYHQHLSYLSLKPLIPFFRKFGLEAVSVERSDIHGGCFRVYIKHKGYTPDTSIDTMLAEENFKGEDFHLFAIKVKMNKDRLFDLVYKFYSEGRNIVAVSSPAKGQTLLNYTGVGRFISFATDKSTLKQGRYTPGTHLKIKSDTNLRGDDVGLLLAWNFQDEIIRNNPQIKTWIIPIPIPTVVER